MLFLLLLVLIALAGYHYFNKQSRDASPWSLSSGVYFGSIPGSVIGNDEKIGQEIPLILDFSKPPYLIMMLETERVAPVVTDLSVFSKAGTAESTIIVKVGKNRLEFESPKALTFDLATSQSYTGRVRNLETGAAADWQVKVSRFKLREAGAFNANEFLRWYGYISELEQIVRLTDTSKASLVALESEIKELEDLVTNKDRMQSFADERLPALRSELLEAQSALREQSALQEQLATELEAAQDLSQKGRLVGLMREVLQRELELYHLKEGRTPALQQVDPELLKKGVEVRSLLNQISEEQNRVLELAGTP